MGINFSIINEINTIRKIKAELSQRESELTTPTFQDYTLIPVIYQYFREILQRKDPEPYIDSPTQRKKFIFIILYLYAPGVLVGGKMPHGLRQCLADTIKLKTPTFISHNIESVVFWVQNDKIYRQEIECIYNEIERRLSAQGAI